MSKRIITEAMTFDGERHIRGEMCWCNPTYDRRSDSYIHVIEFEKKANVSFRAEPPKEYRA